MNKKIIITIFLVMVLGITYYFLFMFNDTFVYSKDGSYGIAIVKGYVKIVREETDCYCPPDAVCGICPPARDVIKFYVIENKSRELKKAIDNWHGDNYREDNMILLGCKNANNIIEYSNAADQFSIEDNFNSSLKKFTLSSEDSSKILASSIDNPVSLRLEKYKLSNNSIYTFCYSRFAKIEVID